MTTPASGVSGAADLPDYAPPSIGHNLRRAVDEIAAANGVPNALTYFVYSQHDVPDHAVAAPRPLVTVSSAVRP